VDGSVERLVLAVELAEVHPAGSDSGFQGGEEKFVLVGVVHGELSAVLVEEGSDGGKPAGLVTGIQGGDSGCEPRLHRLAASGGSG